MVVIEVVDLMILTHKVELVVQEEIFHHTLELV